MHRSPTLPVTAVPPPDAPPIAPEAEPHAPSDPFDAAMFKAVMTDVMEPLLDHWFRPRLIGAHKIPHDGPVIVAANHSGNAFPYDGMVFDASLWRREGYEASRKFRSVYEKELSVTWWMRPFGIDNFYRRGGGVDLSFDNFDRLLARGDRIVYYPEGVPGIGKGFGHRYQLQPFHTSFITLAAKHGAPVVPVSIVNAEWIIPFTYPIKAIDRVMQKLWHVPFLPLPWGILAILWPWAWYLALPARIIAVIGDPIDIAARVRALGHDPQQVDRETAATIAEQLRREMQADLDRHVAKYGRHPYQCRSLGRELKEARKRRILFRILPFGWCPTFVSHERNLHRPPAKNRLHALLRDWDLALFLVPLGWPLLSLARALRRPPCGYRGLTRRERRAREGAFHWKLAQRPLPPRS